VCTSSQDVTTVITYKKALFQDSQSVLFGINKEWIQSGRKAHAHNFNGYAKKGQLQFKEEAKIVCPQFA
jgi:hypothetical protein